MIARPLSSLTLVLLALGLCSCNTTSPPVGAVPTASTQAEWLSRTKDPRFYSMYVHQTPVGPSFDNANRLHDVQFADFKLLKFKKAAVTRIEFKDRRGNRVPALIDTTSRRSWVAMDTAAKMEMELLGKREPHAATPEHVKDDYLGYAMALSTLRLDNIAIENGILFARPQYRTLGPMGRGLEKPIPEALIGVDILEKFTSILIDYPRHQMRVATSSTYKPQTGRVVADLPMKQYRGGLVVEGHMGDYEGYFLIDTAGDYEVAMPFPKRGVEPELWLDNVRFEDVIVSDSTKPGFGSHQIPSIGGRLLSQYRIVIDFARNRLLFEL